MNILITGGAGFIGSQLGLALTNLNNKVILLDNMSHGYEDNYKVNNKNFCEVIHADIRENNFHNYLKGIDTIIHLAAISSLPYCQINPNDAYSNNVDGLINVLEAAKKSNIRRIIFSSTSAVYESNEEEIFSESLQVNPDLVYSLTKHTAENICKSYSKNYDLDIIICRFFNVYGEHADIHRKMPPFISYLAKEFFYDRSPILFNNSNAKRDYIYIDDLINYLILMINSKKQFHSETYNLCSGIGYSVPELFALFQTASQKKIKPIYKDPLEYWDKFPELFNNKPLSRLRIKKEVYKNSIGSNELIKNEFNFIPTTDIKIGLKKVHDYSIKTLKK